MSREQDRAIRAIFAKGRKLVPAIVQDDRSREVLMLAYVNAAALRLTLRTGWAHFYSRSRRKLWKKGETSRHTMRLRSVSYDCDEDTLLYRVRPGGPACHTGRRSCFFRKIRYKNGRSSHA